MYRIPQQQMTLRVHFSVSLFEKLPHDMKSKHTFSNFGMQYSLLKVSPASIVKDSGLVCHVVAEKHIPPSLPA